MAPKNAGWFEVTSSAAERGKQRQKARALKESQWWRNKLAVGVCEYCQNKFEPSQLTMDHVVPLARGGKTVPGNVVPACAACNAQKRLETPVERLLRELAISSKGTDER